MNNDKVLLLYSQTETGKSLDYSFKTRFLAKFPGVNGLNEFA